MITRLLFLIIAGASLLAGLIPLSRYHRYFVVREILQEQNRDYRTRPKRIFFSEEYFNGCGVQPLSIAIQADRMDEVESLLASGLDINEQGRCGMTLLIWAFLCRKYETCEILLKHGADPDLALTEPVEYRDAYVEEGNSFLFVALNHSRPDLFLSALPFSRNALQRDRYGTNLLQRFVARQFVKFVLLTDFEVAEVIDHLLTGGIDINEQGSDGNTVLHLALGSDTSLAVPLLDRGADPLIANADGLTIPERLEKSLQREPNRRSGKYQILAARLAAMGLFDTSTLQAVKASVGDP